MRSVPARVVALAAAVLLLAACTGASDGSGSETPSSASASTSQNLVGTRWVMSGYVDASGQPHDYVSGEPPRLELQRAGALAGTTGCNSFTGRWSADGSALRLEIGATTLVACTSPTAAAQEKAVLAALPRVTSYVRDGEQLDLRGSSGALLLRYREVVASVTGSWGVTGASNGKGGVTSVDPSSVTAQFDTSGNVTGQAGCVAYSGRYEVGPFTRIAVQDLNSTTADCSGAAPAGATAYLAALSSAARYEFGGSTLVMRDASGAVVLTMEPVQS